MSVDRRRAFGWILALAFLVLLLGACAGPETSVTQVWKASWQPPPMKSILVFGASMDEANRRALEDSIVAGLRSHDVAAKPSYQLFPGEPPADAKSARSVVQAAGFEGLLVAKLTTDREKMTYVPGTYGGFWSTYYGPGWGYWDPGYVVTERLVDWEMTLWDTRAEDRLVWTASLQTTNPSTGQEFVNSVSDTIVTLLAKQQLIPG